MKSHELLRSLLQDRNAKELAGETNLSTSTIYKWTEPAASSGTTNPLDRVAQLVRHTDGDRIAQWVCERAGGFFVKNTHTAETERARSVTKATNAIVQEFAQMLSLIATAAADNSITPQEATDIRSRWQKLKSVTEEFVMSCEAGNFDAIHARALKTGA